MRIRIEAGALDTIQDREGVIESDPRESSAGPFGVPYDRVRGSIGVEFDPGGRVDLGAFRCVAADYEIRQQAQELLFEVVGFCREELDAWPEHFEGRGDNFPVYARLVG